MGLTDGICDIVAQSTLLKWIETVTILKSETQFLAKNKNLSAEN